MKRYFAFKAKRKFRSNPSRGLTLIEVIVAIVIIAIAVPAIMVPFSGIKDVKNPEYVIQATYLAQLQMEAISGKFANEIPAVPYPSCTAFQEAVSEVICVDADLPDYSFSWLVEQVTAADLDTVTSGNIFGKKVTLKVSRVDGAMDPIKFYTLFALDSTA
ncbi:MAG: prepilin-type N-terminal cleavage/methylation domain-containing protein [Nitrospinae bacterium]|nr:prepilin-type N-terminal cleavage/methylation domain-containing protein [Nitrospinota bacterium]